jgi:hypothetical protein
MSSRIYSADDERAIARPRLLAEFVIVAPARPLLDDTIREDPA